MSAVSVRDGEKWASAPPGVLPAWVADMDFPVAPAIRRALIRRIDTDLGYPAWYDKSDGGPLGEVFAQRMLARHGFAANPGHTRLFTDVNQAIQVVLHLGTGPGSPVAVHVPACPPFLEVLDRLDRPARPVPFRLVDGSWDPDIDRLADEVRAGCRALLLVNPHNPTGRVFRRAELAEIGRLAVEWDLLVVADEVHAELTHDDHRHIPFASLSDEVAAHTVTITSGSKAFNLAGARCAVAHIGPSRLRAAVDAHRGLLLGQVGALGVAALHAAWTECDDWLTEVRAVLADNRRRVLAGLPDGITHVAPEATYLSWLDCRPLGLGADPAAFFQTEAKVMLFRGTDFGPGGNGFARLNFATSPDLLDEILHRMRTALHDTGKARA
nr:aminotransferase class I/II-fold pyridoxal phosphate-dependent enzyme [Kibdelosporangium sp. MJ126-NF4]CEL16410.1 PLP-dependent enzyme [Kibdelosporangium sp. MJ126-NF4]CTQ90362.1 PLP-dependent enzyme [Kibdelosporangium sp. MJ126-NF4]